MRYSIEDGTLAIWNAVSGQLRWRGTFEDGTVVRAVALPETEDCVALVECPNEWSHVIRVRTDGTVVWRVSERSLESYVDLALKNGRLVVWSFSGYLFTVNPDCGSILEKLFVK